MSKLAVFMPDENTIVQLELDKTTIVGNISTLQANVTKEDEMDSIEETVRLMMEDNPESVMDQLHQESLDELEDDIWDEDYVCGASLDLIGTVHENDDESINYFETNTCGQCGEDIAKITNKMSDKDLAKLINQVLTIWHDHWDLAKDGKNADQRQKVEKLFDKINDLTGFTDMNQYDVAEDVLDKLEE